MSWMLTNRAADLNVNALDTSGCTAVWVACFNGQREVVMLLLAAGADCALVGKADSGMVSSPASIARTSVNGSPSIADAVAAECRLRTADPGRAGQLKAGEIDRDTFRSTLYAEEKRAKAAESTQAQAPAGEEAVASPEAAAGDTATESRVAVA